MARGWRVTGGHGQGSSEHRAPRHGMPPVDLASLCATLAPLRAAPTPVAGRQGLLAPVAGIVKLTQKIARLCSKERTMEGIGLYENAPTFVNREALPAKAKFVWITV